MKYRIVFSPVLATLCLSLVASVFFTTCYGPTFSPAITSIQFTRGKKEIEIPAEKIEDYISINSTLTLFLRPYVAVDDVGELEITTLNHKSQYTDFEVLYNNGDSFAPDGTLEVPMTIRYNGPPESITFTVQAKVTEKGPESRMFMDWCQVDVVVEGRGGE
ncbi:MAG: hypothetical protein FWD94_00305 [Treponema sp.]|nr:hypothetical protein [Treponema sp.]